jgi:hypothetical protein
LNDSKVVLNIVHAFSDGGHFRHFTGHIFDPITPDLPTIPPMREELMPDEFATAPDVGLPWKDDPDLTRILSRYPIRDRSG